MSYSPQLLRRLKSAPTRLIRLCSGYVREQANKCSMKWYCLMIAFICLSFVWIVEQFQECSSDLMIVDDGTTILASDRHGFLYPDNRALGKVQIHSLSEFVARWQLRLSHYQPWNSNVWYSCGIHFVSPNNPDIKYEISIMGAWAKLTIKGSKYPIWRQIAGGEGIELSGSDTVDVVLDTRTGCIKVSTAGAAPRTLVEQIETGPDILYKFGVTLCNAEEVIQLKDFSVDYH